MNNRTRDDFEKQRNEKQLRNLKQNLDKSGDLRSTSGNMADHVIRIEENVKGSDFIQSVRNMSGLNFPLITLYTTQQMVDIRRFCCREKGGCVLGLDKTYNIGEFFVTPTVYKDLSVLKRRSNDHPICLGPTFIHQSSTSKAFGTFLHSIAEELNNEEKSNLIIGSDEELAVKKAIADNLHRSTHVLCTRHLRDNTNRHMEDKVGYPKSTRDDILDAIYGQTGLIQKTDKDTLTYKIEELRHLIDEKDKLVGDNKFLHYFNSKLLPILNEHVIGPVNAGKIPPGWTNNNSESANHILKTAIQWKAQDLLKFIQILREIIDSEHEERCRAVRNMGNYKLSQSYLRHLTDLSTWATLSEEVRQKKICRF